ncbi:aminodeoxychorismate lyase, partial [Methylobacterium trifolii]
GAAPPRASAYAPGSNAFALDGATQGPRPRAFDASEGTKLDPLRNKTYDLGSPKTVPALKQP